jgi:alpha-acetolactate decarboxylase
MLGQVQHTSYQVSKATALVEGLYEGAVRVATLRRTVIWV